MRIHEISGAPDPGPGKVTLPVRKALGAMGQIPPAPALGPRPPPAPRSLAGVGQSPRPACGLLDTPGSSRPASHTLAAWLRPGPPGRRKKAEEEGRGRERGGGRGRRGRGEGKGDHCAHRQHEYLWARGSPGARSGRRGPGCVKPCPRTDDRARGRACPSPVEGPGPRGRAGARGGILLTSRPGARAAARRGRERALNGPRAQGLRGGEGASRWRRPRTHITGTEAHPGSSWRRVACGRSV